MCESKTREHVLATVDEGEERRIIRLVEGESLAIFEQSSGVDTMAAYGAPTHGHKVLCGRAALAQALGADAAHVVEALAAYFAHEGDTPLLSDLMDLLDQAGEHYSYMAWSGDGDIVFRPRQAETQPA